MTKSLYQPSARAQVLTRSRYNRPLDEQETVFETWDQSLDRVIGHQRWMWSRAQGDDLDPWQEEELAELRTIMFNRQALVAGRTLWLGGTELVTRREASMFNCSFLEVRTVHDIVDAFWLLLQGCGVGFKPSSGVLSGFVRKMEIEIVRSTKAVADGKGRPENIESFDPAQKVWTIDIGDSAEAWAKAIGKIVAGKYPAKKLRIILSQIRAAGVRLKGYGWLCSGDTMLAMALQAIGELMNKYAGKLLSKEAIWDIINWLGTVLSSRRSAQIGIIDHHDAEWETIAGRKYPGFDKGSDWYRGMSNNTVAFHEKPTKKQLKDFFDLMVANGGSEPGILNVEAARARAPWFRGLNPCGEILLANYGFCNLAEIDLAKFRNDHVGLHRAAYLIARANYRQTCVNLRDGILQDAWHQTNEYLRLCGVGITGVVRRNDITNWEFQQLQLAATSAAYGMADELGLERPKNVTTIKPSGTLSKIMDTTEGVHKPLGRHIFNHSNFSRHDPVVAKLFEAGYKIWDHPADPSCVLAVLPTPIYEDVQLDKVGKYMLNKESAVHQLERYKRMMKHYVQQNCSCTISYDKEEVKGIVDWYHKNWDDDLVATSFLFRANPFATPEELGYAYLPQEVVTEEAYNEYVSQLQPIELESVGSMDTQLLDEADCPSGVCPTR